MRVYLIFFALGVSVSCPAEERRIDAQGDVLQALQRLPTDTGLIIDGLRLDSIDEAVSLSLQPMAVFKPGARIAIHQADGTTRTEHPPDSRWFQGQILDWPGSRAVVSLHAGSRIRGLLYSGNSDLHFLTVGALGGAIQERGLTGHKIDKQSIQPDRQFECGNSQAPVNFDTAAPQPELQLGTDALARAARSQPGLSGGEPSYWVNLALETDTEYLQLFGGDTGAAAAYAGDLVAYTSIRYQDETDTAIAIGHLSLWASPDPWTQSGALCQMMEFGRYWNDNNEAVERTTAHFLSGRALGGGIAWVGVLCSGSFNYDHGGSCSGLSPQTDNYGGAYGVSGSISGSFDIDNPDIVFDTYIFAHELGHNFDSPHTHCYAGIGGSSEQVDECSNIECGQGDCFCGSPSLPDGQSPGTGAGTVMSYCHTRPGGLGNLAWSLGQDHPYGAQPDRVPTRMSNHVVTRSSAFPGCLDAPVGDGFIFSDRFEALFRQDEPRILQ